MDEIYELFKGLNKEELIETLETIFKEGERAGRSCFSSQPVREILIDILLY